MREIEIKARVRDPQATLAALEKLGIELGKPKKQHDVVYGRPGAIANDPNEVWLRLRTENDTKHILTLKRTVVGKLDSIEHETVVEDLSEIVAIIGQLGFELFSDLTKIRRQAHYGEIEICYDELPELGTFLEAEKLCANDVDNEMIEAELWQFFSQLGINTADQETTKYDILLEQLKGRMNAHAA